MDYFSFKNLKEAFDYLKRHGKQYGINDNAEYVAYVGCAYDIEGGVKGAASYVIFKNGHYLTHNVTVMNGMNRNQLAVLATIGVMNEIPKGGTVAVCTNNPTVEKLRHYERVFKRDYSDILPMYKECKKERNVIFCHRDNKNLGVKVTAMIGFAARMDLEWEDVDERYDKRNMS